jgi:kumamolisin
MALVLGISTGMTLAAMAAPGSWPALQVSTPNMADELSPQVKDGTAKLVGQHDAADTLTVLFMMPFKDRAGLDSFIADVSNPASSNYGHYLTLDEENARFNPDVASEARVATWLRSSGVTDLQLVPNHLYVYAQASTSTFSKLLNVQINDYTLPGNSFYAPDRVPTLPASVSSDVIWIAGLSNQDKIQTNHSAISGGQRGFAPQSSPPYSPVDYATAYDVNPLLSGGYTGAGTNIAITLWLIPPSDATLNSWSSQTGAPVATRANGRLGVILTDGASGQPDDGEAGLDIESSSGMASQAHVNYYEAAHPQFANLAHALNVAGIDPSNLFISNSWGAPESTTAKNAIDGVLAANTATGKDFLFSSGDDGSWANGLDPFPNYPAASAYVTSIGGTRFNADINGTWPGEQTWLYDPHGNQGNPEGSGGGFSNLTNRPAWQNAPGFPANRTKRGYPDIAAVGDPATGMFVCVDNLGCGQIGGTSLSAPLWSAMMDLTDQYVVAHARPHLGFPNPTLYVLASAAQAHPPYHDITVGTNGAYNAGAGWDAVTGLGSPDLYNVARDLAPVVATPTPAPPPCPGQQFTDVCPGTYYYTAVANLVNAHIISGYNTTPPCPTSAWIPCFLPNNTATRGQVSKIITLGANLPINVNGGPHFTDVPQNNTFYQYIETMYNANIIGGYTTGCPSGNPCFKPNNNVTRGQLSKMDSLAFGFNEAVSGQTFQDVPPGSTFYPYVQRLNGRGIISGYACGGPGEPCVPPTNRPYFRPNNNITRGQLAKIVDLSRQQP